MSTLCAPMTEAEKEIARLFYGDERQEPGNCVFVVRDTQRATAGLFIAVDEWMEEFNSFTADLYPLDEILVADEFGELSCLTGW